MGGWLSTVFCGVWGGGGGGGGVAIASQMEREIKYKYKRQYCGYYRIVLDLPPRFRWLKNSWQILYLYCDKRGDIQWNIAWVRGKSWEQSPRYFSRAQAIFHHTSDLSHNTDILNNNSSINLPGRSILEELILCIAHTAGQYR